MTLKSDAKFEEKLTLGSKNDMRNLVNFNVNSSKSEKLHFDVLLLSIAYRVSAKKSTEALSLMTRKRDPNFEEKLPFCLKYGMRYLVNFNPSTRKSGNFHFDGLTFIESMWSLS